VASQTASASVVVRLAFAPPYDRATVLEYLRRRAVPGVEAPFDKLRVTSPFDKLRVTSPFEDLCGGTAGDAGTYRRVVRLAHGPVVIEVVRFEAAAVEFATDGLDERDRGELERKLRALFDCAADPQAIDATLARDPLLAPSVRRRPGLRVPGAVDGFELAVRAILGQQVSVAGARTLAGRLVLRCGPQLAAPHGALTHAFPSAAELAAANLDGLGLTGARIRALRALAEAVASGSVTLEPGCAPETCATSAAEASAAETSAAETRAAETRAAETCAALVALPGIGPWTAAYIAMRALRNADAFPASDLGLRNAFARAGLAANPRAIEARSQAWRPYRAYAVLHLWMSLAKISG
jgi:AraC family transcriptional regulator of adaptative response / DNA-3-methyladenine glycosylase II